MSEELSHQEMQGIGEEVVGVLCNIFDPEIPVDIYQLGLIYDVKVSKLSGRGKYAARSQREISRIR